MAMIVFSLILLMPSDNQGTFDYSEIILVGFKILVFFSVLALTVFVMKKAKINSDRIEPFVAHLKTKEASLVILLALGLSIALFAHYFNLHFIIGAFFAGLIFGSNFWGEKIHQHNSKLISGITFGFFAPLFFVFIGLEFNLTSLSNSFPLLIALLSVAISSKIAGGFVASKITKFSNKESILIGCLMNGRGMVEMAIATLGYTMGLIDTALFSVVIAIGFLTTIITPVIAKPFVYRSKSDNSSVPHKPNDSNLNKNEEMIEGESKKTEYKIDIEKRKIPNELKAVKSIDVGEIKKSNFFNLIEKIRQNLCTYKN